MTEKKPTPSMRERQDARRALLREAMAAKAEAPVKAIPMMVTTALGVPTVNGVFDL